MRRPGRGRDLCAGLATAMLLSVAATPARAQTETGPHGELRSGVECSACHTTADWRTLRDPLAFDHAKQTGFELTGRHAAADCGSCHLDLRYDRPRARQTDCGTCHLDVHQGRLEAECSTCHNTRSFADAASLEQHARGLFPLTGAHVEIPCESCHRGDANGAYSALDSDCYSCHTSDYAATQSVDHAATGLPKECGQCHTTLTWRSARFDHAADTGFPLEGLHATIECRACHANPDGSLINQGAGPSDCLACHRSDYDNEHAGSGFPLDCNGCHSPAGWEREPFDHAAEAHGFELLGQHIQAPCTDCHVGNDGLRFNATDQNDCVACHQSDYDAEHGGTGYPLTCERCHSVNGWSAADFEHGTVANGFDLEGQHRVIDCGACHLTPGTELRWTVTGQEDCVACHRPDYDTEHAGSGIPDTCALCHDATDWSRASFDHLAFGKGFALTGAHAAATCTACHGAGNTLLFPTPSGSEDCVACHRVEYDGQHGGTAIPVTCPDCHTTDTFTGATFDHATTSFPLDGAHLAADCSVCHGAGGALIVPMPAGPADCVSCHRPDYDAVHAGSAFPTTCLDCHTTDTFTGAVFDHDATVFRLQGAHAAAPCSSCHDPNGALIVGPPSSQTDCIACHQSDYDSQHSGTGYPIDCLVCHDQIDFASATFDHDAQFFPIYSGKHKEPWNSCADCHPSSANLSVFTCLSCHEHRQSAMDDKHSAVSGYSYDSQACLSCHPTGN